MNKKKEEENMKERVERLLGIDIYSQAKRPREEVQKELREYGIDAVALAKEAMRITKEAVERARTSDNAAASPSPVRGVVEGVKESIASATRAGKKIADHVHETATTLAVGLSDFFVTSPFGGLQAAPMRGGSGAGTTLKLRIPSLGVRVTFRLKDARGEKAFARVVSLNDAKVSHILDGGIVIAGGNTVGQFADGYAEFATATLTGQIGLRDSQGKPLEAVVESAS
jgi:hypothetical protein